MMKKIFLFLITTNLSAKVILAIPSIPTNLNPFFATDANSQNINRLIHLSLIDFNEKMEPYCVLCENFQESHLPNGGYNITFTLKKNIKFSDNSNFEINDVKNAISYYQDSKINSLYKDAFSKIKSVDILNNQIRLNYASFDQEHLSNLVLLKILKIKDDSNDFTKFINLGEYVYKEITPLEINLKSRTAAEDLIFKVVRDETTLALKLINKEIDVSLRSPSSRKLNWLLANHDTLRASTSVGTAFTYIGINHKKKKLQDLRLRMALSKMIPRNDILKYKLKETATLATSFFAPSFYFHQDIINDDYNENEIKSLLEQAGYKLVNKKWEKNGIPLKLEFKIATSGNNVEIAEIIKHYFLKSGIELNTNTMEWGAYMTAYKQGNYDLILANWLGFTGQEMLTSAFSSKKIPPQGLNRIFYSNKELDKVLDEATVTLDKKKREDLYQKAEQIAFRDYAYIPLWHPTVIYTMRKCIKNLQPLPNDSFLALSKIKNEC